MIPKPRLFLKKLFFSSSKAYWERRYKKGGTSGKGSHGKIAEFKAEILNKFVKDHQINSVIELGSGDGGQLTLAQYDFYVGLDVSKTVIAKCQELFKDDKSKKFFVIDRDLITTHQAIKYDLALSLDVIFHLVEDEVYNQHLNDLFALSNKYVIIRSTNSAQIKDPYPHVKHRCFTDSISLNFKDWKLKEVIKKPSLRNPTPNSADFYIYKHQ